MKIFWSCLYLFFLFNTAFFSCQQREEKKDAYNEQFYSSLQTTTEQLKQYVRVLDSALLQASMLENILQHPDSAKNAIMSRDQDMVSIYKPEKTPILDTASNDTRPEMQEAQVILEKSRASIREANKYLEMQAANQQFVDSLGPNIEVKKAYDAQVKKLSDIIIQVKHQNDSLEQQLNLAN